MDFTLAVAGLAVAVLAVVRIKQLLGARSPLPLPPSPKGLPVLGNLLDLACDDVHVKCRDWSRHFGILHSPETAFRAHLCIILDCRSRYHLS
jgi:transposase InsO family protein